MPTRRDFLTITALALPGALQATPASDRRLATALSSLEKNNGGRLGVAVFNTATNERTGHRIDERFPMCSTFKFLLASRVLQRVDQRQESLERTINIPLKPLLFNSPLTEAYAGKTMTVADLCHAILTRSDNTAANLLLESIGGPPGITRYCRSIGDQDTRLDRTELALNESADGDPRDTTTPGAMAADLQSVLLGGVLSMHARQQLTRWMESNLTGLDRLRAGLPPHWRTADKTGANGEHTSNDIAVFWPTDRPPVIVTAFITQCKGPESKRAKMLADVGHLVRTWVG